MNPGNIKPSDTEAEVWDAISAFERILEVMPDDRTSLDTLVHAYTQLGDHTRARDYLVRLAVVVADEQDAEAAGLLIEKIKPFVETDPSIKALCERLSALASGSEATGAGGAEPAREETAKKSVSVGGRESLLHKKVNITEELSFAWDLLQAGELTQEQYAEVVQDLTEISSNASDKGALSMLHVIETRGFGNMDRVLVFAAHKGDTPLINLSNFEMNDEAISLLPLDYMIRQGVLPFDMLGPDILVVIQNPYDRELRKRIEQIAGRNAHFFLTPPHEFNTAIGQVQKKLAEAAAKAASK